MEELQMPARVDITNQKFGRLTAIRPTAERKGGCVVWECLCECGNTAFVTAKAMRSGNTQSCGCLHKDVVRQTFSKDLTGQRFGSLIALRPTDKRKHGSIVWECLCDCGNIHESYTEVLLSGHSQSCGCIRSRGNQKIKQILQKLNINFVSEYQIRVNDINYYYDFAVIDNNKVNYFIEYDGILHYEYDINHGWNNKENWEKTHHNDEIKNQYAKDNGIPLIRIPYFDYEKIDENYVKEKMKCIEHT
jgi:hypothetical protein